MSAKSQSINVYRSGYSIVSQDDRSSSLLTSILNVVKTCIGAGILSFPWAFACGSLWPSMFICIFTAAYSLICGMLIVHGCEVTGIFEYSALLKTVGSWAEKACALAVCYCVFSTCLGFCILIPQFLQPAFSVMFGIQRFGFDDQMYILITAPFVLYPLCLLKDLSSLRFSSVIGIVAIFYSLGLFVYEAIHHHQMGESPGTASDPDAGLDANQWTVGIFIVINVASKANNCHYSLPPIYESLRDRSIKRMWFVMLVSYAIVTAIYVTFAFCGYYLFGTDSDANVLDNFGDEAGAAVSVARLGTAFSIIGCFPLIFKAGINALETQFFSDPGSKWNFNENSRVRTFVITVILAVLTFLSLFLDDIGPVASIEGAVTVLLLICAFPILIYWKVRFGGGTVDVRQELHDHMEMTTYKMMNEEIEKSHSLPSVRRAYDARDTFRSKIALGILFLLGIGSGISGLVMSVVILRQDECPNL